MPPDDRHSPLKLHAVAPLPAEEVAGNGGVHDDRVEGRDRVADPEKPFHTPRTAAEVAANAAVESLAASIKASEWAGEAMAASKAARDAVKGLADDVSGLRTDQRETSAVVTQLSRDVLGLAKGLNATRSVSRGDLQLHLPGSLPDLKRSPTGSHFEMDAEQAQGIIERLADLEMEGRRKEEEAAISAAKQKGAEEALADLQKENAAAEKKKLQEAAAAGAREKKWRNRIIFIGTAGAGLYEAIRFLGQHFH